MQKFENKLVEGLIPANQECPFKSRCEIAQAGKCAHLGKNAPKPFSCASARAFDMMREKE